MEHGHGTVVACEGEHAIVLFRRQEDGPCAACPGTDLCSTLPPEECERKVRATNKMGAVPGDTVSIRLADETELGLALFHAFGFPTIMALAGLAVGVMAARTVGLSSEAIQISGFAGLFVSLVVWIPVSRFLDRIRSREGMFVPIVEPPRVTASGCGGLFARRASCFAPKELPDRS